MKNDSITKRIDYGGIGWQVTEIEALVWRERGIFRCEIVRAMAFVTRGFGSRIQEMDMLDFLVPSEVSDIEDELEARLEADEKHGADEADDAS